jgi:hypothetical protein
MCDLSAAVIGARVFANKHFSKGLTMSWVMQTILVLSSLLILVAAVIYIALQVRENTISRRSEALQQVSSLNSDWMSHITLNAEIARMFRLGQKDISNLATDDAVRYGSLLTQFCHNYDAHYHVHQRQPFPEDFWQSCIRSMQYVLCTRGARVWWASYGHQYSTSFQNLVNQLMEDTPTT